jgi:hypothetical protein
MRRLRGCERSVPRVGHRLTGALAPFLGRFRQANWEMDALCDMASFRRLARMYRDLAKHHIENTDVPAAPDGADG